MKKIPALILGLALTLALCSCGLRFDPEAEVKAAVNDDAYIYCLNSFSNVKDVYTDITTIDVKDNIYTVYGTVRIHDVYNEEYAGKLSAKYLLNEQHVFIKIRLQLETPQIGA